LRIFRTPPYRDVQELLDICRVVRAETTQRELETTLRDIRRANIFGLGTWVVKHHLSRMLGVPGRGRVTILDVATGSADIPQALCRWGEVAGVDLAVVATDKSHEILRVARERIDHAGLDGRVSFLACDATRLPFGAGEFDFVTCSLAFHHLDPRQARLALREMARVGRRGFVVNDIYRSRGAWYMAVLLSTLTTSNRLTRHDGPASVLRAYTPAEMRRLSEWAGVKVNVYRHPFWRMAAVAKL
jgi:ubiquinone/menaquinone biosynthesis C-methylase UbiE